MERRFMAVMIEDRIFRSAENLLDRKRTIETP